ncbi:hypothetical protein [Pandoravirus japonicus]|uniref:Uncharacterized protein n=1 Tax=Pandoravirus japonicus TaxID=2823154 RepID=A0A811BR81_9VIRU|nr:hypothetical protein [Pandoravirus japonicus]
MSHRFTFPETALSDGRRGAMFFDYGPDIARGVAQYRVAFCNEFPVPDGETDLSAHFVAVARDFPLVTMVDPATGFDCLRVGNVPFDPEYKRFNILIDPCGNSIIAKLVARDRQEHASADRPEPARPDSNSKKKNQRRRLRRRAKAHRAAAAPTAV